MMDGEKDEKDEKPALREGMDASRQCRLILNEPERGHMRLCSESKGKFKYHNKLTQEALMAQYRAVYPAAAYPAKLGAGTWIKTVRDAAKESADRWVGVGIWEKIFRSFQLELRESDIEWKPSNRSFVSCFDSLNREEVSLAGLSARKTVRIVNTYIPNWDFLRKSFEQAVRMSADIQILLLDFKSAQVAYRAEALGISQARFEDEIQNSLSFLSRFYKDKSAPPRFEVRLFDAAPVASIYWFDDVCYLGLHWMRQFSIETPQFRIEKEKNSVLFSSMERHFEALWQDSGNRRFLPESS